MPALRRNLTAGSSAIRHPLAPISTQRLIRQIEVDQAVLLGEADRDVSLRTIELCLRLEHIERCVQRGWARCVPGALVVVLAQPGPKALAAKRPGFPVAVDSEIGKAGAVACVKEPSSRCDVEEDVCAAHGVRPSSAWPMATCSDRDSLVSLDAEAIGRVSGRTARPDW